MKNIIIILFLSIISNKCISQVSRHVRDDSLFIASNGDLSHDYIKIEYVGEQNHFVPPIYIENAGECNTGFGKCSCSAGYTFHLGLYAYTFLLNDYSYPVFKKLILDNMKNVKYDSSFDKYGAFEVCIKKENHIDTTYAYSFQFLEDLKKQLDNLHSVCYLWIIPAINDLEFYSRIYIKPDEYNKR